MSSITGRIVRTRRPSRARSARRDGSRGRRRRAPVGLLTTAAVVAALSSVLLLPRRGAAQVPDTFTNLQHFPEDISRDSLIAVMRRFSFALNVPCRYCHAGGPEDNPFSLRDVDFASDEKVEKRRARYMLGMVDRINGELLSELPPRADAPGHVRVECRTCHRGLARPRMIDSVVVEKIEREGVGAAVAHYRDLRERYYGDWRYDFDARVMIELATELAERDRTSAAIEILTMMTDYHPESASVWLTLGDLQRMAGRGGAAVASYRRVLEFAPGHRGALRRLREMGVSDPAGSS